MPNRVIREAWLDSEAVDKLSVEAERFFLRLCLKADDHGRFHGHTQLLKSQLFPLRETLRNTDITAWLAECEATGVVRCYEVAGKKYVLIPKFNQRYRNRVSRFPAPPDEATRELAVIHGLKAVIHSPEADTRGLVGDGDEDGDGDGDDVVYEDGDGGGDDVVYGEHTKRLHNIPSCPEEVIAYGKTLNPPVPEDRCRDFWNHYEAQAKTNPDGGFFWVTSGDTVITNWKAKLPQFSAGGNQAASGARKPNPRNAGTYGDPAEQGRRIADKIARQAKEHTHD